jgi:hypothetical protein
MGALSTNTEHIQGLLEIMFAGDCNLSRAAMGQHIAGHECKK